MAKIQQHPFAVMRDSLAPTRIGDIVMVSTDIGIQPTRYTVEDVAAPDTFHLRGDKGAKRTLVVAAAEQVVWLSKGTRSRRVVQAWRDVAMDDPVSEQGSAINPGHVLPRPFHGFIAGMFEAVGLGDAADGVSDYEAIAILAGRVIAMAGDKSELEKTYAVLGRKLEAVDSDRHACRVALAQLRNAANGASPGAMPLPNYEPPHSVVIDVLAAMDRRSSGAKRTPILVPPDVMYRGAIAQALPERMRGENGDQQ